MTGAIDTVKRRVLAPSDARRTQLDKKCREASRPRDIGCSALIASIRRAHALSKMDSLRASWGALSKRAARQVETVLAPTNRLI